MARAKHLLPVVLLVAREGICLKLHCLSCFPWRDISGKMWLRRCLFSEGEIELCVFPNMFDLMND